MIRRILLIDEDDEARAVRAHALATAGYAVIEARTMKCGIRLARVAAPDIVVVGDRVRVENEFNAGGGSPAAPHA